MVRIPLNLSACSSQATLLSSVFLFIAVFNAVKTGTASTYSPPNRFSRQLAYNADRGGLGYVQPYHQRQQSAEVNFFQTMMSLNFDVTEVIAMYRNVTAIAETPGCLGHCRTPMALWVVQSFYPCHNLKKADCPKGLVCCMQDPASRIEASANTLQDTRIKVRPSLVEALTSKQEGSPSSPANVVNPGIPAHQPVTPTPQPATQSTTEFDEEYWKNNFIQDEIPE